MSESNGSGTYSGTHVYDAGGIYTVTVTLFDDDAGSTTAISTAVVVGAGVNNDTLNVIGTGGDDRVTINPVGRGKRNGRAPNLLRVHADFLPDRGRFRDFDAADIQKIVVILCGGGRSRHSGRPHSD